MGQDNVLRILALTCLAGLVLFPISSGAAIWHKTGLGIDESGIRTVLADPFNHSTLYIGTSRGLYQSADAGAYFRAALSPSGDQKGVNNIYIAPDQSGVVYAATDGGLYMSPDAGLTWERVYFAAQAPARTCLSVLKSRDTVYLGTGEGLYRKTDGGAGWVRMSEGVGDEAVYHIADDEQFVYAATRRELFRLNLQTGNVQEVFSSKISGGNVRDGSSGQATPDEVPAGAQDKPIKFVYAAGPARSPIFLGSAQGIFFTTDQAGTWRRLEGGHLPLDAMTAILVAGGPWLEGGPCRGQGCPKILAATEKGVFAFEDHAWVPLYQGMETDAVNHLAQNGRGTVYAATGKGLFYLSDGKALSMDAAQSFAHEPGIADVHRWAIEYAQVSPEKIRRWSTQARRRAFLPDLSVGLDRDAADLFHWDTGASPDNLQTGRELMDWDVTLSWDLGDLVWNPDQTSIDSRSKLMSELRGDILSEVTRLYFERRRTQVEAVSGILSDPRSSVEKEMRIAELTALIDALTGGAFSRGITPGKN